MRRSSQPWIIAHRGVPSEAPENTLASFERAIQLGADLIELDVRQTADGQVVVIHDGTLDRTTNGCGQVSALTLAELQSLDAGGWMGKEFENARVPTLREALALTDGRVGLVIEIKIGSSQYPGIESRIVGLLEQALRLENTIIISADGAAIDAVKQLNRRVATLYFGNDPRAYRRGENGAGNAETGTSFGEFVFCDYEDLDAETVTQAHARCLGVLTSLIPVEAPTPTEIVRLASSGADGIFTNNPRELRRILDP